MKKRRNSKGAVFLIVGFLSGCATESGYRRERITRPERVLAVAASSESLPTITLDQFKTWKCEAYLNTFSPSLFTEERLRTLDLRDFSVKTAIAGFPEATKLPLADIVSLSDPAKLVFENAQPWSMELALFPGVRSMMREVAADRIGSDLKAAFGKFARDFSRTGSAAWEAAAIATKADELRALQVKNETSEATMLTLCGLHVRIWEVPDCMASLKRILADMLPTQGFVPVTLIDEFQEFLTDSRNYPVLINLNAELVDLIEGFDRTATLPDIDLFEFIERSYLNHGFAPEEAFHRAWKFLGIYSTSGANLAMRSSKFLDGGELAEYQVSNLLALFSASVADLDSRMYFSGGRFFSMPRNLETTVNSGKLITSG